MAYSLNILTDDWVFSDGSLVGTSLVMAANSTATQVITASELSLVPEKMLLEVTSTRYAARYAPQDMVYFTIEYNDFSSDSIIVPLCESAEIYPKSDVKETVTMVIKVSETTTISAISLKLEQDSGLQEGVSYFGVSISRDYGLKIEKSEGASKLMLNSDELKWQIKNELDEMVDRLYFDAVAGDLRYNGLFAANAISAIEAEIDFVVSNTLITNVLAADKGYIAELTVDRLETSDKVQRYLLSNIDDVNFIRIQDQNIEFITASTDGTSYSQALDRNDVRLYWMDATHEAITTDITDYPVYIYDYDEVTKLKMHFDEAEPNKLPFFIFGQGTSETDPLRGKGYIYKDETGLIVEYVEQVYGTSKRIRLDDDGIHQIGNDGEIGLRNIHICDAEPATPQIRDLWIDTNDFSRYDIQVVDSDITLEVGCPEVIITSGVTAVTLFTAVGNAGCILTIKRVDATNTTTITPNGSETIDGAASVSLSSNYQVSRLISDGTNWLVI